MGKVVNLFERVNRSNQMIVPGPGKFEFDIVGESNYQEALDELATRKKIQEEPLVFEAALIYESDNPYDSNAIKVQIECMTVGYLNRENARYYRHQMTELGYEGYQVKCSAKIVGGWERDDGQRAYYGVRLDMPTMSVKDL